MNKKEFNFNNELKKIFETELSGKITNAGRIYRKLIARDKEFIRRLKEKKRESNTGSFIVIKEEDLNKLAGEDK